MKKIFVFVCIVGLVLLSSCSAEQKDNEKILPDYSGEEVFDEQVELTQPDDIEVEPVPLYADNVNELINIIKEVQQGKRANTNNVSSLDNLVVPNFSLDGFSLFKIEVTDISIFYYYKPITTSRVNDLIDYKTDVVVTVRRSEYVKKDNPLQPLIDQLKISPDEDGHLYDEVTNEITFAYENVWVSIRFPDTMKNLQENKNLCSVTTIAVK